MQLELKPTTQRAGIAGGLVGVGIALLNFVIGLIPFLGCLLAPLTVLISLLVPLGTGAYSVMLARQAGAPSGNTGQDAVDGALAGIIGALIAGIVSLILGVLRAALHIGVEVGSSGDAAAGTAALGIGLLFGLCGGVVFAVIFGGILGAIGGAVYGLIRQNRSGASAGTPSM